MFNYALIVTIMCPSIGDLKFLSTISSIENNAENVWLDQRIRSSFHVAILFHLLIGMICLLSSKKLIILILDMKYDEDDSNKYINVGIIKNSTMKIVTTVITVILIIIIIITIIKPCKEKKMISM